MNSIEAIQILRTAFPAMRRTGPTAIVHSGGKQTIFTCVCGSRHTASTDWNGRNAKHVRNWKKEHESCAINLAEKIKQGEAIKACFGR